MTFKTILHLAKFYPPEQGGIETVTRLLAEGMASKYEVTVLCFTNRPQQMATSSNTRLKLVRCKNLLTIASQPLSLWYVVQAMRLGYQSDIIHVHMPNLLAALACLFVPSQKKIIIHWHSDIIGKGVLGKWVQPLVKKLLQRSDRIIATSANYAQASPLLSMRLDKVDIIPIGIKDQSSQSACVLTDKRLKDFIEDKQVVLSVGRLVPYKGFHYLIDAARYLTEQQVVVIVGEGEQQPILQQQIIQANLSNKVYLAGRLTHDNLISIYQQADCFCLSSIERTEAFGVVLVEAMSFGLPIVATNILGSGVNWVNQHQVTGLNVPVKQAQALADAITLVLTDTPQRLAYQANARTRFKKLFTSDVMVNAVEDCYRQA